MVMPSDNSVAHVDEVGALEDGDYVTLGQTDTLVDLPEFGQDTTDLLEELDVEALKSLTGSLADITQDQRADVDRLFDGVQKISDVLVNRREQLGRTLDRAEALVDVAESRDDQVVEIIDNFQVTLDTLLAKQDEIERLLDETANTSTVAADFVSERRAQIDRVVADLRRRWTWSTPTRSTSPTPCPTWRSASKASPPSATSTPRRRTPATGATSSRPGWAPSASRPPGCGSAFDEAMTALLGPDPSCDGYNQIPGPDNPTQDPGPGEQTDNDGCGPAASTSALDAVFRQGLRRVRSPRPRREHDDLAPPRPDRPRSWPCSPCSAHADRLRALRHARRLPRPGPVPPHVQPVPRFAGPDPRHQAWDRRHARRRRGLRTVVANMRIEPNVELPADVRAVVLTDALLGERYVQLTPAYEDGPSSSPGG